MAINASQVMKLREVTGLGMMTCKKALIDSDGDMEKAIEDLRKQGQLTAAKRAGKAAKEGKVDIKIKDSDVLIYEVNSETDFVARNNDFLTFVANIGEVIIDNKPSNIDEAKALTSKLFDGQSIEEKTVEIVGKIGEKINFRRFKIITLDKARERAYSYIHGNGKIGVVVILSMDKRDILDSPVAAQLGKDIAMQVAASKPIAIDRNKISEGIIAKEKEIYLSQVQSSGKPEKIWGKIVEGKLNKFFKQTTLIEQEFIKDTDISVEERIKQAEKEIDASIAVTSFIRFELGCED